METETQQQWREPRIYDELRGGLVVDVHRTGPHDANGEPTGRDVISQVLYNDGARRDFVNVMVAEAVVAQVAEVVNE